MNNGVDVVTGVTTNGADEFTGVTTVGLVWAAAGRLAGAGGAATAPLASHPNTPAATNICFKE
jgi:hypothetical protein